jgi:hypothetical protein
MDNIETPQALAELIADDYPISKDGLKKIDLYAYALKNNELDRNAHSMLCINLLPQSLKLFPQYPLFMRFIEWVKQAGLDSTDFYGSLFHFIDTEWTEEKYPKRIFERLFVIEQMIDKTFLLSFPWIEQTSPKALKENPWKRHDILYRFDKDKAFRNLDDLLPISFFRNMLLRLSPYLKEMDKYVLKKYLLRYESSISKEDFQKLNQWIDKIST